uniref:Uncharacterized protein n=1 Tax=Anguilla anguilla TaxID=7936 RepID=A0A0E9XSH0_ANGAN
MLHLPFLIMLKIIFLVIQNVSFLL